jgi:hypothetical protein
MVDTHSSLNFSLAGVSTDCLDGMLNEETQSSITYHRISEVYKLVRRRHNKPFPVKAAFLTFEVPTLPIAVCIGYVKVSVLLSEPYAVLPLPKIWTHTQQ